MSQVRFFLDSFLYYDLSGFYGHFPTDRVRVSKATILQDFTYCNHSFQSWLWWLSLQISPQGTGALKLSLLSWTWCYKSEYCLSFSETKLLLFIQQMIWILKYTNIFKIYLLYDFYFIFKVLRQNWNFLWKNHYLSKARNDIAMKIGSFDI